MHHRPCRRVRRLLVIGLAGLLAGTAAAQSSTSFRLEEFAFNSGGSTALVASPSFRILPPSALGRPVSARGLTGASFRLDACFECAYRPPGEVLGLAFADAQRLTWSPEPSAGSYRLYRDSLASLAGFGYGLCLADGLGAAEYADGDPLPEGEGFFYLVTVTNRLGMEGSRGLDSSGGERRGTPCP